MNLSKLVKGCPLFHEIYDDEVDLVLNDCVVATYEAGSTIVKQGDTGTEIFVILSGKANIIIEKDGHSHFIAELSRGDLFGEMVLINEVERTANIIAKDKCDILIITQEHFFSFFNKRPKLFSLLILNLTRLVTKRLKNANIQIENLRKELDLTCSKNNK